MKQKSIPIIKESGLHTTSAKFSNVIAKETNGGEKVEPIISTVAFHGTTVKQPNPTKFGGLDGRRRDFGGRKIKHTGI